MRKLEALNVGLIHELCTDHATLARIAAEAGLPFLTRAPLPQLSLSPHI